jgi:transcriptional regulator GlxA family with amidase domain
MRDELCYLGSNWTPKKQMIASVCSGALLLAALGLLAGKNSHNVSDNKTVA